MLNKPVNLISISISFVHSAIEKVPLDQEVIDNILHESRIPLHLMREPNARVSLDQYSNLVTSLMLTCNDELLGHANEPLPIGSLSLLTHWLVSCTDMNQALNRMVLFYQILGRSLSAERHRENDQIVITLKNGSSKKGVSPFLAEFSFFCLHRILCWLRKEIVPISHLAFQFEAPQYARDYRLMFYSAPASFSCNSTSIRFSDDLLNKPIHQNLTSLKDLLKSPNKALLMLNFHADNWGAKVNEAIQNRLHNLPSLPELAESMSMQPYTLQRRLAEEGLTYLAIKNQVKRDAAIDLLVNTELSIVAISVQLGFSEISPFTRCFKKWTGMPPSAYRKY